MKIEFTNVIVRDAAGNVIGVGKGEIPLVESPPLAIDTPEVDPVISALPTPVEFTIGHVGGVEPVNASSTPASGSVFPLGLTVVQALVTDALGVTVTGSFNVRVVEPLALHLPPDVTIETEGDSAPVAYGEATTTGGWNPRIEYSQPSGSSFPAGQTTPVLVDAYDDAGQHVSDDILVTVIKKHVDPPPVGTHTYFERMRTHPNCVYAVSMRDQAEINDLKFSGPISTKATYDPQRDACRCRKISDSAPNMTEHDGQVFQVADQLIAPGKKHRHRWDGRIKVGAAVFAWQHRWDFPYVTTGTSAETPFQIGIRHSKWVDIRSKLDASERWLHTMVSHGPRADGSCGDLFFLASVAQAPEQPTATSPNWGAGWYAGDHGMVTSTAKPSRSVPLFTEEENRTIYVIRFGIGAEYPAHDYNLSGTGIHLPAGRFNQISVYHANPRGVIQLCDGAELVGAPSGVNGWKIPQMGAGSGGQQDFYTHSPLDLWVRNAAVVLYEDPHADVSEWIDTATEDLT